MSSDAILDVVPAKKSRKCCWTPGWEDFTALWEVLTAPVDGVYLGQMLNTVWKAPVIFWGFGAQSLTGIAVGTKAGAFGAIIHWRYNGTYQNDQGKLPIEGSAAQEHEANVTQDGEIDEQRLLVPREGRTNKPTCGQKSFGWYSLIWDGVAHANVLASTPILLVDQIWGEVLPLWGSIPIYTILLGLAGVATVGQIRPCRAAVMHHLYGTPIDVYDKMPPDFFTWFATCYEAISALINCYSIAQWLDLFTQAAPAFWNISASGAAVGLFLGLLALLSTAVWHTNVTMKYQDQNHHHEGDDWTKIFRTFTPIQKVKFIIFMIGDYIGHTGTYATSTNIVVSGKVRSLEHLWKLLIYTGITIGGGLAAKAESTNCRVEAATTMRDNPNYFTFHGFFSCRQRKGATGKPPKVELVDSQEFRK
ncbi:MAG TPA: hypothetical protein VGV92_03825 [Gammaproteobacteria bacterium]|nr:hypothetical protein [Gammaproteobacteria bacterium]